MRSSPSPLDLIYPRVDEIEVFLMALAIIVVGATWADLDFVRQIWPSLKTELSRNPSAGVVALMGLLLLGAALAISLALPFTHADPGGLCKPVLILHGFLIASTNGYYALAGLPEAGFDANRVLNWFFAFYAVSWLVVLLVLEDVVELDEREANPREALCAGAICTGLLLIATKIVDLHPVLAYSFAALGASSIHLIVRGFISPKPG